MSKTTPNTQPFDKLRQLIREESKRTNQIPKIVEISEDIAKALSKMDANDWYAATKTFTGYDECEKLVGDFSEKGGEAANGLSLSPSGPRLQVASNLDALPVRIISGHTRK